MRLVHDDEVPRSLLGRGAMRSTLRLVDGRDQERPMLPVADRSKDRETQVELGLHLLPPLARERGGRENERPAPQTAGRVFPEVQARFDRLAEAHFVLEE